MLRFDKRVIACLLFWLALWLAWAMFMVNVAEATGEVARAQAIARTVWHNPCDGNVRIAWTNATIDANLTPNMAAYVLEGERPCVVYMRSDMRYGWQSFCATMIHEYGHLAGMEHSTNPHSIMYPVVSTDRRCRR